MSTIIGLSDLAEDEIISKPLPMEMQLNNLKINITEDRPPVNITSPGPVPINLQIGKMRIKRNTAGIFEIQPVETNDTNISNTMNIPEKFVTHKKERDRELISLQLVMQQLKLDNDSLKKQLTLAEKSNEIKT